jgi:hypothetical protein
MKNPIQRDLFLVPGKEWGVSATNRRVRNYKLTAAGAKHLECEVSGFERMLEGITRVLAPEES